MLKKDDWATSRLSIRSSVHVEQLDSHWTDYHAISYKVLLLKYFETFQLWLMSDEITTRHKYLRRLRQKYKKYVAKMQLFSSCLSCRYAVDICVTLDYPAVARVPRKLPKRNAKQIVFDCKCVANKGETL